MDSLVNNNYQELKTALRNDLNQLAQSFVVIGYRLKKIRDEVLYKIDGYKTITEFAQAEYNLSQTSTSRFIAINDRYSIGGNSPQLLPEYEGYGYSKLSEMLTMSDDELKLVSVRTTRAEIREIKQWARESGAENYAPAHNDESPEITQSEPDFSASKTFIIPDADKLLIDFFRDKFRKNMLKELAAVIPSGLTDENIQKVIEIINPSGHLMFRKGMIILIFEEDHIKYSKFGGFNTQFTYIDLVNDICAVFDMSQPDPWISFYGEPEPEPEKEPERKEPEKKPESKVPSSNKTEHKPPEAKKLVKVPENTITAQARQEKEPEIESKDTEPANEDIPGQMHITDYPEVIPEPAENEHEDVEIIEADVVENSGECKACSGQAKLLSTDDISVEIDTKAAELVIASYIDGQRDKVHKVKINNCPLCGKRFDA